MGSLIGRFKIESPLCRPVSKGVASSIKASVEKAEGSAASQYLLDLVRAAAESAQAEVACAEQLQECTASHSQQGSPEALQLLEDTIEKALTFFRLKVSLQNCNVPLIDLL